MSDFTVEVFDTNHIIEIETSTAVTHGEGIGVVDIETSTASSIEISTGFSAAITTNLVYASDVIGLTEFLTNFMDTFEIDCGTP